MTVNQSQTETVKVNAGGVTGTAVNRSRTNKHVVNRLPSSTTNMTGFLAMWRGDELPEAVAQRASEDRAVEEAAGGSVHVSTSFRPAP